MHLEPISIIQGVKFFDNAPSCISHFKKMHWARKAISLILSFETHFLYALNTLRLKSARLIAPMETPSKKRLVVCIHGLNRNPLQFKKIVDEMQRKDLSSTDILVPYVLGRGNAKLDEMAESIFEEIANWAKTSGDKELVLIGISNGGRIARAIDAKIEKCSTVKRLRFVSIVGACKGSSLANLANTLGLSSLMSKNISAEMPTTSIRNQQLNRDWENGLSTGPVRDYTFFASPHDWQVPNYDSTLMDVRGREARYAIIPNHGHNSIVDAVAKTVADLIFH